jgi:hypothetical protein
MPKKPQSSTHSIEKVLRTIFGSEGNSPVVIDMSDVAKPYTKFELLLTEHQRKSLVEFCSLSKRLKKKLETAGSGRQTVIVTRSEMDLLHDEIGGSARYAPATDRKRLMSVQTRIVKLFERDHHDLLDRLSPPKKAKKPTKTIYQFKITLSYTEPVIWRRIQVQDSKLNTLHYHIQAAMGWTNSHLHYFVIGDKRCGIPEWLEDPFNECPVIDSTKTMLSYFLPTTSKPMKFQYTYDLGDNWEHEILFEQIVERDRNQKYPICLEGERACPPDDCGGVPGDLPPLNETTSGATIPGGRNQGRARDATRKA